VSVLIRHRLPVRFRDCDPLGHVNNAAYLTYLEQARFALWRAQTDFLGRPGNGPRGCGFIMARAEVDFRAQARYGDELEIRLSLAAIGRTSFTYTYDVVRVPDETIIASAKTVQVWFDYDAERPVPISDDIRTKLARPVDN